MPQNLGKHQGAEHRNQHKEQGICDFSGWLLIRQKVKSGKAQMTRILRDRKRNHAFRCS